MTLTRRWYALKSKPKKELSAAAQLSRAGIETFFPQVPKRERKGASTSLEALFPGYLFSRLSPLENELRLASYTYGVSRIVGYGDEPWPLPDDLIQALQQRVALENARSSPKTFQPGERIVITDGPFRDVEAVFDRKISAAGRVTVLVKILQRVCRAELDSRQMRRAEAA